MASRQIVPTQEWKPIFMVSISEKCLSATRDYVKRLIIQNSIVVLDFNRKVPGGSFSGYTLKAPASQTQGSG